MLYTNALTNDIREAETYKTKFLGRSMILGDSQKILVFSVPHPSSVPDRCQLIGGHLNVRLPPWLI